MANDPAETAFIFEGEQWRFLFDWEALRSYEREMREDLVVLVVEMERYGDAVRTGHPEAWRLKPRTSAIAELMRAGLQRHHPGVTAQLAGRMFYDPVVQEAFGVAFKQAMPMGSDDDPGGDGAGERPPAPTKKARASTGGGSSPAGSRSGKPKKASGDRHRA